MTIKPGTVVEFGPNTTLMVNGGALMAMGQDGDSIYFKPDAATPWNKIMVKLGGALTMDRCVVHGGTSVYVQMAKASITNSHIYDMQYGIDAVGTTLDDMTCTDNHIASCSLYGIRGTTAAGTFDGNIIENCLCGGILWIGDRVSNVEAPLFTHNDVHYNGTGTVPMSGAYFNATTARLECNKLAHNLPFQVKCESQGNVVMNDLSGLYPTPNLLIGVQTDLACYYEADCANAQMVSPITPLMWVSGSAPQLSYGYNTFSFDNDGTYIFRKTLTCSPLLDVTDNYFYPVNNPPAAGNFHFCPDVGFSGTALASSTTECSTSGPGSNGLLSESMTLYRQGAIAERDSNYALAHNAYESVITQYPQSEQALWATRASLRTGLEASQSAALLHDTLAGVYSNTSLPLALRQSARREAVWALLSAQNYLAATSDLQAIMNSPMPDDSLWAAIMMEVVTLVQESNGPGTESLGPDGDVMGERVNAFHDRLNRLMGRPTDDEVLAAKAVPVVKSDKLCRAYPNPFNNTVNIAFELPQDGNVRLDIFNLLGQKVVALVNEPMKAGSHTYRWSGETASSGVYFYRFVTGNHVETQKLMLLK